MTNEFTTYDFLFKNITFLAEITISYRDRQWTQVPVPENERLQSLVKGVYCSNLLKIWQALEI